MNRENQRNKMLIKEFFTKDKLLVLKKYDRLLAYDIPYAVINRAYKRYVTRIDDYAEAKGYPKHWFKKDRIAFCNAVKMFIESRKYNPTYNIGTYGYTSIEIAKLSEIDKYILTMKL